MGKRQTWLGLLSLTGAAMSGYFLLFRGAFALLASSMIQGFERLLPPEQARPTDLGDFAASSMFAASLGLCLTLGLIDLGWRNLSGKAGLSKRIIAVYVIGSLLFVGISSLSVYSVTKPASMPPGYVELEGIWHASDSDKPTYRFNPDGTLDSWWSGLSGGKVGRWTRSGKTISVVLDRGWSFVGTLSGSTIKGSEFVTSSKTKTTPKEWVRDVKP